MWNFLHLSHSFIWIIVIIMLVLLFFCTRPFYLLYSWNYNMFTIEKLQISRKHYRLEFSGWIFDRFGSQKMFDEIFGWIVSMRKITNVRWPSLIKSFSHQSCYKIEIKGLTNHCLWSHKVVRNRHLWQAKSHSLSPFMPFSP